MSRFEKVVSSWVSSTLLPPSTPCTYSHSLDEDVSNSSDPSRRLFKVTFCKPSSSTPVPSASAHLKVFVNFENNDYILKGYTVEGKKQLLPPEFPFNERWVDKIVERKNKLRAKLNLVGVDLVGGSKFLDTRLPKKVEEEKKNDSAGEGEE
ncbi:hypothetical protein TrLO_g7604 [Triparma laevis f. longispina]|uniref:Uncharacterized protein n=1 Tax=Triparma laevis f. longispina TaxID=1714387 RepID=A0A9W7CEY9_9STRA|nr:hypothetical protein TrLO_g7604 [Triparma laevis f. longispina]